MTRKEVLTGKLARLNKKRDEKKTRALASTDVNEVRALQAELEDLNAEINETQAEIDAIDAEERSANIKPDNAQLVNGNVLGTFKTADTDKRSEDPLETMEYRKAFMAYVQNGKPIEKRAGEVITTADTGAVIPLTIMREIINTVRVSYGNLYNKVRKLNIQGGVEFPVGSLKASFKWINESTVSPNQKLAKLGKISFGYHTCEIRIAISFLASVTALDVFETEISRVIAEAFLEAMDQAIVNGSGDGMPLGILNDPRANTADNIVEMTAEEFSDWTEWRKKFFATLPLKYRAGEFIFPVATVDAYLETMHDDNNNPVFRQATGLEVNDGDAANPNGRFYGREISLVEPDIIKPFDEADDGDVVGLFWQPNEYAMNENFGFTVRRYFDDDTNEWISKALVVTDGKILNPLGVRIIKKKVA